ncbi:hypothetical protein FQN60_016180 [Etheostoma spectabile]|uniref:EGF-like domain-containing protein n=1 Tax=Etheostoma spectabile TaxID=54343 RepID=A0A5J5CXW1_9PERO|nr:hypothetical protein FQN60_016180 [Etheostoma spectabile]
MNVSFKLHERAGLTTFLDKVDARQPFLLRTGEQKKKIQKFCIVVDQKAIPCEAQTSVAAFDVLFKAHSVFSLSYDEAFYTFIQTTVYNINVGNAKGTESTTTARPLKGKPVQKSCPAEEDSQECKNPFNIFQGCMRLLTVDNQPVDLIKVLQRLLGNYSHLQIDMCGIIDRCSPSRCEHGGRCSQSWTGFHCNCSDSGYSGATCHSCE